MTTSDTTPTIPLDERLAEAFTAEGLDETDAWAATNAAMPIIREHAAQRYSDGAAAGDASARDDIAHRIGAIR